jgi:ribosomal protein L37E
METPDSLLCERCGAESRVIFTDDTSIKGFPTQWPKFRTRNGALYVFIDCPECGEHDQAVATEGDVPPN